MLAGGGADDMDGLMRHKTRGSEMKVGECVSRHGLVEQGCLQNQLTWVPHRSAAFSTRRMVAEWCAALSQGAHRETTAKILQGGRF